MRAGVAAAAVVFVLACPLYSESAGAGDFHFHNQIAGDLYRHGIWPPHPLFHLTLIALCRGDFFPPPGLTAPGMSVFICAASLAAVTWLATSMIEKAGARPALAGVLGVIIAFAMPLRDWWGGDPHLGKIPPNVWHNPTGVFAMPFALGLFVVAMRLLDRPGLGRAALFGLVAFLSLLAKPSYFLAFAPAIGLALLSVAWRMRPTRAVGMLVLAFGPAALVLGAQLLWLAGDTVVIYVPFGVWRDYARDHILGCALVSIAFPLAVVLCYPRRANADHPLILAWVTLAVGVGTYICFAERGLRLLHGNFGWGMIYANHVLFVVSAAFLFGQRNDWRRWICLSLLALHGLSGALHVLHVRDW